MSPENNIENSSGSVISDKPHDYPRHCRQRFWHTDPGTNGDDQRHGLIQRVAEDGQRHHCGAQVTWAASGRVGTERAADHAGRLGQTDVPPARRAVGHRAGRRRGGARRAPRRLHRGWRRSWERGVAGHAAGCVSRPTKAHRVSGLEILFNGTGN